MTQESCQYEFTEAEKNLAGHIILSNAYYHIMSIGDAGKMLLDLRSKCHLICDNQRISPISLTWLLDLRRDGPFIGIKAVAHA